MTTHSPDWEKLREEWNATDLAKDFAPFEDAVASWWLSKLQAREEELRMEIEKIPSLGRSTEETPISKQDVLALLTPKN